MVAKPPIDVDVQDASSPAFAHVRRNSLQRRKRRTQRLHTIGVWPTSRLIDAFYCVTQPASGQPRDSHLSAKSSCGANRSNTGEWADLRIARVSLGSDQVVASVAPNPGLFQQ